MLYADDSVMVCDDSELLFGAMFWMKITHRRRKKNHTPEKKEKKKTFKEKKKLKKIMIVTYKGSRVKLKKNSTKLKSGLKLTQFL